MRIIRMQNSPYLANLILGYTSELFLFCFSKWLDNVHLFHSKSLWLPQFVVCIPWLCVSSSAKKIGFQVSFCIYRRVVLKEILKHNGSSLTQCHYSQSRFCSWVTCLQYMSYWNGHLHESGVVYQLFHEWGSCMYVFLWTKLEWKCSLWVKITHHIPWRV